MGLVPEPELAKQLGLSRDELRFLRETHCDEGKHFQRSKGHVSWMPSGIALVKKEAGAMGTDPATGSEKKGGEDAPELAAIGSPAPGAADEAEDAGGETEGAGEAPALKDEGVIELTVFSVPPRNTRILDARKKDGRAVRVRVNNNLNFMAGMTIRARWGGEWPDVYNLEGRCPRQRGKW